MISYGREWYETVFCSLFSGKENSWYYKRLQKLLSLEQSTDCEQKQSDTGLRFKAFMDYAADMIICERMGKNSYQLPFAVSRVARGLFDKSVAPIAAEAVMTIGNWDYRVRSNLLEFILFDDHAENCFLEKMTIYFMALEETKKLEEEYSDKYRKMSLAEYYPEILAELDDVNESFVLEMLERIRSSSRNCSLMYDDILWKANESRIHENMMELYQKSKKSKCNFKRNMLDEETVSFMEADIKDYEMHGYSSSYNPFWIFGSQKYQENLEFILSRKQVIEFDTVWIHYLALKSKLCSQEMKYVSSFQSRCYI